MGGGALVAVSLSISDVRVALGQADFPLRTPERVFRPAVVQPLTSCLEGPDPRLRVEASPVGRDDHVTLGLAVVAHALHAVDLGQVVDDLAVLSVHGWEAVGPLCLLALQTAAEQAKNQLCWTSPNIAQRFTRIRISVIFIFY